MSSRNEVCTLPEFVPCGSSEIPLTTVGFETCIQQTATPDLTVELVNESRYSFAHLYLSQGGDWGEDLLAGAGLDRGGDTFAVTGVPCGVYDIRLVGPGGSYPSVLPGVDICHQRTSLPLESLGLEGLKGVAPGIERR
ncbi:MAG: hypothetical protein P8R54_07245 [Myxococcota bacterium]|nr:hypothetical protein [Myxococcota bacterium]